MTRLERIEADYLIETAFDPRQAIEVMAGEQSSGTFVPVPGETPELKARSAARVERMEILGEVEAPSLPGSGLPKGVAAPRRVSVRTTLSWPLDNIGPSLPNLMATVAGNLFELKQFSGLRLLDIRLPDAFADAYPGPKFGVPGTRRLAEKIHHGRAPSLGRSSQRSPVDMSTKGKQAVSGPVRAASASTLTAVSLVSATTWATALL